MQTHLQQPHIFQLCRGHNSTHHGCRVWPKIFLPGTTDKQLIPQQSMCLLGRRMCTYLTPVPRIFPCHMVRKEKILRHPKLVKRFQQGKACTWPKPTQQHTCLHHTEYTWSW